MVFFLHNSLQIAVMKIFYLSVTLFLFSIPVVQAQKWSLDLYGGFTNYQGDLQDKRYTFNQAHLAGGIGVSYAINEHFSARAGFLIGKLSGDDQYGRNSDRNLKFQTSLTEGHLALQYYIRPLEYRTLAPYVFAGIAVFHYNPYTYDTSGSKYYLKPLATEGQGFVPGHEEYSLTGFAIPFGGGVKFSLSETVSVGLELGLRKTFSDYIDDVSTNYVDQSLLLANSGAKAVELAYRGGEIKSGGLYPAAGTIRGGAKYKDWYYFTGFTLSINLGDGSGGRPGKNGNGVGCPVNVY